MQTMRGVIRCASFGRQEVEQFREDAVRGRCSGKTVSPLRISQAVKTRDFDSCMRWFESIILSHNTEPGRLLAAGCKSTGIIALRGVAQLVAQCIWDAWVAGSSPVTPTNSRSDGTGRHGGFKTRWRNPCGFNSHLRDHTTHAYYNSCCMYYIWAYIISKD